jgi:N-dimethylarginine dimethylaminohydrolase
MPTVAMCAPHEFRVGPPINPWMRAAPPVDPALAGIQWRELADTYAALGVDVVTVEPEAGLSDMVFAADAGLLAARAVVPSAFRYRERRREEVHWRRIFADLGVELLALPPGVCFEGGDAVRCGDTVFLGHGFRTDARAAPLLEELVHAEVVPVPLTDPWFFHLDTCCATLDEHTMLLARDVLPGQAEAAIRARVRHIIDVPREAACAFACNLIAVGTCVVAPLGAEHIRPSLAEAGFDLRAVDVGEFIKAGGGVRCLTLVHDALTTRAAAIASTGSADRAP